MELFAQGGRDPHAVEDLTTGWRLATSVSLFLSNEQDLSIHRRPLGHTGRSVGRWLPGAG
ncbi:protein of unknown function [Candidatus Promineifilum breve]|uniref:Uncharacterized protein n=1 Tax=Candidatus Promineifilum breve TaxID=1806508 RepID=A0A161KAX7_9CHLR|nr:protein of unknown function [Candidatus Promineifilum breve]